MLLHAASSDDGDKTTAFKASGGGGDGGSACMMHRQLPWNAQVARGVFVVQCGASSSSSQDGGVLPFACFCLLSLQPNNIKLLNTKVHVLGSAGTQLGHYQSKLYLTAAHPEPRVCCVGWYTLWLWTTSSALGARRVSRLCVGHMMNNTPSATRPTTVTL
jgi:hypothetical protein